MKKFLRHKDLSVLIVTYGDHREFLKKSIESLFQFEKYISNIIIVQNGIQYDLNNFLGTLRKNDISIIKIVNEENLGSAGGFKIGVEKALDISGDTLLILDDDNYVPNESFNRLVNLNLDTYESLYGKKIAFSLYRPQHDQDKTKFERNYDFNLEYFKNTVNQFSFLHKFNRNKEKDYRKIDDICKLTVAPYSGLCIRKKFIKDNEMIESSYFVYSDDTRFTARLTLNGIRILQLKQLYAIDMEESWYQKDVADIAQENDVMLFLKMDDVKDLWRPFYRVRNGVDLSRRVFKKGKIIFWINFIIYLIAPFFLYMPKNKKGMRNYLLFVKAVLSGYRGHLGKVIF